MKKFIFVAGFDYGFTRLNFRWRCENRYSQFLAGNKAKEDMTFQIFDFGTGEVITIEEKFPGGKRIKPPKVTTLNQFKKISRANYHQVKGEHSLHFNDGERDKMSILDIYHAVQQVGVSAPHTLVELSIFSHAFGNGPILVNSFDNGQDFITKTDLPKLARDPDDMDGREAKDFVPPTMDPSDLSEFQSAFHKEDGHIWIWGWSYEEIYDEILGKIEDNPKYRAGKVGNNEVYTLTNLTLDAATVIENTLKYRVRPFPNKKKIDIEFKFLRYFFCMVNAGSYASRISSSTKVKTFAAVAGTGSILDFLMRVENKFFRHFAFYKNHLHFNFDPEGRNYGLFNPGYACPIAEY